MSISKQIKTVRGWMSKSSQSLTDTGYHVTLDSSLRVYRDYHIRNPNMIQTFYRSDSSPEMNRLNEKPDQSDVLNEAKFKLGIHELKNFKESNCILAKNKTNSLASEVSWCHLCAANKKQWKNGSPYENFFDATNVDIPVYEGFFYGSKHTNYYSIDDVIGLIILSLKVEIFHGEEYIRILARSSLVSLHVVTLPSLLGVYEHYSDPFSWIESLTHLMKLSTPLRAISHHTNGQALVKLERVFVKSDFKIGVLYVKEGQQSEEEIFSNTSHSSNFERFLNILGEHVKLHEFQGYSGGLDTSPTCLNGEESIYTQYRMNDIMFHVSTLMPNTGEDNKFLGKKRHIGNDVLCVVFSDTPETSFSPLWIKSQFIYSYIIVQVQPASPGKELNKEFRLKFKVSVICRQEVPWFGPELIDGGEFEYGEEFRDWLLQKIINGDRACYNAPKFATVQERTRSQIMQSILDNEMMNDERIVHSSSLPSSASNSLESLGRSVSDDSLYNMDETSQKLKYFVGSQADGINAGDVAFLAGKTYKKRVYGNRSVLCRRSRVFRDMLINFTHPGDVVTDLEVNANSKGKSLTRLAMKKAKMRVVKQSSHKKGKFSIESSLQTSPKNEELVTTTSFKKGGKTYEISNDSIGRTREFVMNEFEADIFSGVMEYIHNDKCTITYSTLPGLLCAATYYELPELRLSCLNRIYDVVSATTVCQMLNIVEEYLFFKDGRELQEKLVQFFLKNVEEISKCADNFVVLNKNRISLVLSQNWKFYSKLKGKILSDWARFKDPVDWRNLAQSVISSCHEVDEVTLEDFQI